ncbi:IclR family transcriptional regulator [Haloferax gibbonsii]|uniref:IclR family transcriptional regulator n=1 Tax=Haloferax gibbonsii TaxID=35746 RepID=UPI0009E1AA04|nr:IclR family transcriptional regulator [Haloferax gibbonsii]
MDKPNKAKNPVKGVQKMIEVVEALKQNNGARVSNLAEEVDLPKSSIHNYLSTLREAGFVVKRDQKYHVGLRFLDFGSFARSRYDLFEIAKPEVEKIAAQTGELSNLMVEEQGIGVYLHRAAGNQAVNVDARMGHRVKMHNTALGKAILAYKSKEEVNQILDSHGMNQTTANTIVDKEQLFEQLREVRENKIAYDMEERLPGLRCVAAPITSEENTVIGAISVSGPTSRFSEERLNEEIPEVLRNATNIIELNVTYP